MFKNIKFRNSLLSLLLGLLLFTVVSIMFVNRYYNEKSVDTLVVNLIDDAIINLEDDAKAYFFSSSQFLYRVQKMAEYGLFKNQDMEWIKKFLFSSINAQDKHEALFAGNKNGDFYMAKRMDDKTVSVKIIKRKENMLETKWFHSSDEYKEEFKDEKIHIDKAEFDPRTRNWYKKAIKSDSVIATEVYNFFTDKKPGITSAVALKNVDNSFVLGMDIGLETISQFLENEKISKNSKMYVLDDKNNIIAQLDAKLEKLPYSIKESKDELLIKALKESEKSDFKNFSVLNFNNEEYINSVTTGVGRFGFAWKLAIVVPKSDFLEGVQKNEIATTVIASVFTIILLIVGTMFANAISEDLEEVSVQMKRIEKFDLSQQKDIQSNIIEINNVIEALNSMRTGLKSFSKYVPSNLVRQLIELKQEATLGGDKKSVSIFFSDIQNFTNISEKMLPEELVIDLAEYFTIYSNIILENKGTIDKYIGDSIMAFWGAPRELKHHELLVCKAALACKEEENRLMQKWKKFDKLLFISRIGIHTGEVIVGNMGSQNRLNYSIIGDNTNLASRLEGLNKYYGTQIMISQTTYAAVKDDVNVRFLDLVTVKGKTQPIKIYELLSLKEDLNEADATLIELSSRAHDLYFSQEWAHAVELYEKLVKEFDDPVAKVFITRCKAFLIQAPSSDWNGVHNLESK